LPRFEGVADAGSERGDRRAAMKKKDPNRYPKGWNAARVRKVLDHYENQTEKEAVAEDEAAFGRGLTTVMEIPTALVDDVVSMIADYERREKAGPRRSKKRKTA
jgi:hypothetical protein